MFRPDGPIGQRNPETRWLDMGRPTRARTPLNTALTLGYRVVLPIALGTLANFTIGNHSIEAEVIDTLIAGAGINGGKLLFDQSGSLVRRNRRLREQRAGYLKEIGTRRHVARRNARDGRIHDDGVRAGSDGSRITTRLSRGWGAAQRPGSDHH